MNLAEWILVSFLSVALLIFLILAIIALAKWNSLVDEAKKIVVKSQDIAATANDIAENVKGITSVGGLVQTLTDKFADSIKSPKAPAKSTNKSSASASKPKSPEK